MPSVHDAAAYFINRASEDGYLLTHFKLQKLCYYAQGYSLALANEVMFDEPIEAWEHGPVVKSLYQTYKSYQKRAIPATSQQPEIEPWRARILELVNQRYGWMAAWNLRNQTHTEQPWQEAWLSDEPNAVLSHDSMKQFFRSCLKGERRKPKPADRELVLERLKSNDALREATERGRAQFAAGRGRRWD